MKYVAGLLFLSSAVYILFAQWLGIMGEIKGECTVKEVMDWETTQKKNFLAAQSERERNSDSERIKQISDK